MRIGDGLLNDPIAQLEKQIVLLKPRNKNPGGNRSEFIVFPSNERLHAGHRLGFRVDDGLITQEKAFAMIDNGFSDFVEHRQMSGIAMKHVVVDDVELRRSVVFSLMDHLHRRIVNRADIQSILSINIKETAANFNGHLNAVNFKKILIIGF